MGKKILPSPGLQPLEEEIFIPENPFGNFIPVWVNQARNSWNRPFTEGRFLVKSFKNKQPSVNEL